MHRTLCPGTSGRALFCISHSRPCTGVGCGHLHNFTPAAGFSGSTWNLLGIFLSGGDRDNGLWGSLFEGFGVDFQLQGRLHNILEPVRRPSL
jgi:hypothetical protein